MEAHEMRKKANIEAAKTMLNDTRRMIAETVSRVSKTKAEYDEAKKQYLRKMQKLENIHGDQCKKLEQLNTNISHLRTLLQPRKEEGMRLNAELREELQKCQEEEIAMNVKFSQILEELEEKVNAGYAQIREERDLEMELEIGLGSLKPEEQLPFVEEVVKRRKELFRKRHEERQRELKELEEAQKKAEEEIKVRTEELSQMRDKNAKLTETYKIVKKNAERKLRENQIFGDRNET